MELRETNSAMNRTYQHTILIVEDEDFLRSLIATSLENAGFKVVTAGNSADARRVINSVDPDAVVLDIDLGLGPTGFDIAEYLRKKFKDIGIVFLTTLPDPRFAGREMNEIGRNEAYLNKNILTDIEELCKAIRLVLVDSLERKYRHHESKERSFASLSKTQVQILQLISEGRTNQEIAHIRKRSLAATEGTIGRLFEALGIQTSDNINSRVAATRKLLEIIRPSSIEPG